MDNHPGYVWSSGCESSNQTHSLPRRRFLQATLTSGAIITAGCLGGDGSNNGDETTDDDTDSNDEGNNSSGDDGDGDRPVTGKPVAKFEPLDEAMHRYMDDLDLGAGVLAVMQDGGVVYERGFGWGDAEKTRAVEPDTLFRIGSISKVFTDDAIGRLVDAGDIALSDEVYPLLEVDPPDGGLADDRFEDVTVEHLLNHQGGWDRSHHSNPLFDPLVVREALDLSEPPGRDDVIRYMLGEPLQFDPGDRTVYSNVGYLLLGHVIESVTGTAYQEYLETTLFADAGVADISLGQTRPENRPDEEIWYDDREQCSDVFDPNGEGSCADVGLVVESFDAAGGHVARSSSLLAVLDTIEHVWLDPSMAPQPDEQGWRDTLPSGPLFGSLYGSWTYVERRPGDRTVVAMFNGRHPLVEPSTAIAEEMDAAFDEAGDW